VADVNLGQLDARVVEINAELESLQSDKDVHQAAISEIDRKRVALRVEREGLSKFRESARASQVIATHEQAAAKARADADAALADLNAKNKEADELLAKLKAQTEASITSASISTEPLKV